MAPGARVRRSRSGEANFRLIQTSDKKGKEEANRKGCRPRMILVCRTGCVGATMRTEIKLKIRK